MISVHARLAVATLGSALCWTNGVVFGAQPDLGVAVLGAGSDLRPVTAPGQPVSFRIGLDNMNGVVDAHHVRLSVLLPSGLTFSAADPPPTSVESGTRVVWEMDALPAQALPRVFEVTADTGTNLTPGTRLEISAAAESAESNVNADRNHATYTIDVQPVGPALDLTGSTLDSVALTADGSTTFEVDVMNAGNLPATEARLEVTLPNEVQLDKADPQPETSSGPVVIFNLGDLARAEARSITMTVNIDPRQLPALQSNPAMTFAFRPLRKAAGVDVADGRFEIVKHIESTGHDLAVWLAIEGATVPGQMSPGDDVHSVITYANLGNQVAHNVAVALRLGAGLKIAQSTPQPTGSDTSNDYAGGIAHWNIGDLGVGMSHSIRSTVHVFSVPEDGSLMDATVTADGVDLDSSNNTAALLWHAPLPPGALASARRSLGAANSPAHATSHVWRHVVEVFLLIVAAMIFIRARRNRNPSGA